MREAERQPKIRRDLRAVIGTPQYPKLRPRRRHRLGADVLGWVALDQPFPGGPADQVAHGGGELVSRDIGPRIERVGGATVGSRRSPKSEIDASGRDGV